MNLLTYLFSYLFAYMTTVKYVCLSSAICRGESEVHMDTAHNGRRVARRHGDAGVRGGGVASADGHVAASWRTTSGRQTSIRARSVHQHTSL